MVRAWISNKLICCASGNLMTNALFVLSGSTVWFFHRTAGESPSGLPHAAASSEALLSDAVPWSLGVS